jgi:hypothetical protein
MIELSDFRGRIVLTMVAVPQGKDLCVALFGGDTPHIGAVALSQPRPSLKKDGRLSATTSVIAVLGHKEDELARLIASRLAGSLGVIVTVSCGIHMDEATPSELKDIVELSQEMTENLILQLNPLLQGAAGPAGRP